jgi:hypothetical protein
MNFPVILDVALGLVFIFFVLSLLASELQEIIGTLLQWRAEHLKKSIEVLLSGNDRDKEKLAQDLADALYDSPWIRSLNQQDKGRITRTFRGATHFIGRIYRALTGNRNTFGEGKTSGPSYIPSEAFANSLLERMQLGSLWQIITDERLKAFTSEKILLPVNNVLNDLKASTGNEFLLNSELQQLETAIKDIIQDFQEGRVGLPESLDRMVNKLDEFTRMASDILPDNHHLTETFLRRLDYIKLGLAGTPTEQAALLSKLRPTVEQLLDVFEDGTPTKNELIQLAQRGNPMAKALLDRLGTQTITPALRDSLAAIARKVQTTTDTVQTAIRNEVQIFGHEVEKWFDRGMERATGVYKRNAKAVALLIGIATAISINADSFHISTRLIQDPVLRDSITSTANQLAAEAGDDLAGSINEVQTAVDEALAEIPFPLGYNEVVLEQQFEAEANWPVPLIPRRVLGWVISGFAISMGSTFWFNVLKKIINVRNTGEKET